MVKSAKIKALYYFNLQGWAGGVGFLNERRSQWGSKNIVEYRRGMRRWVKIDMTAESGKLKREWREKSIISGWYDGAKASQQVQFIEQS